jgi:NAD(P)-dependent dehydrogenase (short-subunit alcohol dehydrogenase family)
MKITCTSLIILIILIIMIARSVSNALRKVLVTGANKGIGKAISTKLLTDYSDVSVLLGSRDAERGLAAVDSIVNELEESFRKRIELLVIDVSKDE